MAVEKVDNRRKFVIGEDTYYIAPPTAVDIKGADWQYSKRYTEALVEGIVTSAEMNDILTRRGIIGPEFRQRAEELTETLDVRITQLNEAKTLEEKRELAIKVAEARDEVFSWNQRLNGPMNNTCEQVADDARLEYLTSCMIQTEDGNRVWASCDDYMVDNDRRELSNRSKFEVMIYLQGLESDFIEKTPEAIAMREVEEEAVAKTKEAVKALAEMQKEAEVESKEKKKTPKKSSKKKVKSTGSKTVAKGASKGAKEK